MAVSSDYTPPQDPLEILHHDAQILVLNKPAGLLSVPGRGEHLADCLLTRVKAAFPEALLVHRLDRDTSGILIFGVTPHAQRHLSMQFEKRSAKKAYVARLEGHLEPRAGEVDLPLIVDWPNRPRQMVCHDTGKPALTEYRVVKYGPGETRVRLTPKTGRTHQLRLHMMALGHAILGDPLYASAEGRDHPRMMLHSEELRIKHPDSGESMKFRAKASF
ncbi:RluA family pseudouridine synthase [Pseudophaeobacter sp.]|uniref:RluA family pseudouridine synthase n=1 Tax=Pseudophaeobacter sp. TaxID=1971739 RepID=UPI003299B46D